MTHSRGHALGENGSAIVELALCVPVLILIVLGTGDFARVFYTSIALSDAARAGAQYGAHSVTQSGNTSGMQTAATGAVNCWNFSANSRVTRSSTASAPSAGRANNTVCTKS